MSNKVARAILLTKKVIVVSTLDEFIERLIELRGVAKNGGKTPVVIVCESNDGEPHNHEFEFESAAAEVMNVMLPNDDIWICAEKGNTEQVINIF